MKQTLKSTLLLLAVLLLGGLLPARAQVGEARSDLAIGVNGGINLSSVTFNPTIKTTNLMGMCGGLTIRYTCEKYFTAICALQMEINYTQRGWKEDIEDGSGNTYQRTTNYLEVPFMFNMGWGREQRGVKFFINAGPQMNLFLSETMQWKCSLLAVVKMLGTLPKWLMCLLSKWQFKTLTQFFHLKKTALSCYIIKDNIALTPLKQKSAKLL